MTGKGFAVCWAAPYQQRIIDNRPIVAQKCDEVDLRTGKMCRSQRLDPAMGSRPERNSPAEGPAGLSQRSERGAKRRQLRLELFRFVHPDPLSARLWITRIAAWPNFLKCSFWISFGGNAVKA